MDQITDRGSSGRVAAFLAVLTASALMLTGTASAHQLFPYEYEKSFNGSDSTAGAFTGGLLRVEVNQSNGRLYVMDPHAGVNQISQFNAAGVAQLWSGLPGVSSFAAGPSSFNDDMTFDNSGHGGGLYVANSFPGNKSIKAFREDGTERLQFGNGQKCGIGVGPGGIVNTGSGQFGYQWDPDTGFEVDNGEFLIEQQTCKIIVDNEGNYYLSKGEIEGSNRGLFKFGKLDELPGFFKPNPKEVPPLRFSYVAMQYAALDQGTNDIFGIETNKVTEYSPQGQPVTTFGLPEGPYTGLASPTGIAVNKTTHDVYVTSKPGGVGRIDIFHQGAPVTVPDATTVAAGHPSATSGVMKGTINPDGVKTTQCKFEWGTTTQYNNGSVACFEGNEFEGSGDQGVSAEVTSLTTGQAFHYRVAAKNGNERWSYGADRLFEASSAPTSTPVLVDRVNTDGARFTAQVTPHGGTTSYHFEVGEEDCSSNPCTHVPLSDVKLESNTASGEVQQTAIGLKPNTYYYVRLVAENGAGQATPSHIFHTYPSPPGDDPCPNAHVRQQTSASLLPDCRAYELVSAANAGGYDVESDLVPGQSPFTAFPDAKERVLYGLHFGSIPGIAGSPTNYGVDPYVAERGNSGWTTKYVGIPADGMADPAAFGSPLLGADETLDSFAFGGAGICNPCFAGAGTNLPLRLKGGAPIKGMAGTSNPETAPTGHVAKYLSDDGSHLVFGSTKKFEEAGVEGALTIYQRDLNGGTTQVVSTDETGLTFSGAGTAALDQSTDGSRVVVGKYLSTDTAGNDRYHLYMHIGSSASSADLTPAPGVSAGAIFDGMTSDGSAVFLTTTDKLLGTDTDVSADIYEAAVSGGGAVTLRLVSVKSTGAVSNDDSCTPPGIPDNWNAPSGEGKCNAVAYAAGSGLASDDGTFYFVSPELLEGAEGTVNQANLYVVKPSANPHFVATIDSSLVKPGSPTPSHPVASANFTGGSLSSPESLAVDQSNGDLYVGLTSGGGKVSRFKENGEPREFTEGPGAGTNTIPVGTFSSTESQIAIDNAAASPFTGDLYVTHGAGSIDVYSPTGLKLGSINGSGTNSGSFGYECGVAVEQSTGALYIGDEGGQKIWRYLPTGSAPITDADYTVTGISTSGLNPCVVAADAAGHVYGQQWSNGPLKRYEASQFAAGPPPSQSGSQVTAKSLAINTDPSTNELFVNEGSQIVVFNAAGEKLSTFGSGSISGSRGVAINKTTHHVYAPSGSAIVEFGYNLPPYTPIDNPGIVHGVKQAGTRSTADFQATPDGHYAVFNSVMALSEFENLGHSEVWRYDAQEDEFECASCATTGSPAKFDVFLSPYGINLADNGSVFFTTEEGLVLSDTNERADAYEWQGGTEVGRISTGGGNTDSKLLSVSRDGIDAFFFTRQTLVPSDENGAAVKIYDARKNGGYQTFPAALPCAASDECHGPGTQAPPPPNINTITGPGPINEEPEPKPKRCKKGFVKRNGKCVKRHHKTHKRHNHRTNGNG